MAQHQPPDLDTALNGLLCELRHLEGSYRADTSREQLPELWAWLDRIQPHLEERWPARPITSRGLWDHPDVDHGSA